MCLDLIRLCRKEQLHVVRSTRKMPHPMGRPFPIDTPVENEHLLGARKDHAITRWNIHHVASIRDCPFLAIEELSITNMGIEKASNGVIK